MIKMEAIVWIDNYLNRAEQLIYEGRVEEAMNIMRDLLFEEPGYAPLHNYLGWAYLYHVNNVALVELHLRTAIRFASVYAPPYLHLGSLLNRAGRYAEAIDILNAGLLRPEANRIAMLEGIAYAYEVQGNYRRAIRAYRDAAKASVIDFEVDRLLNGVKRCRRKRIAALF